MDICLTQNRFCLPLPAMIWSIFAKIIRGKLEEISRMNPQTQCSRIEKKNQSHFTLAYSQSWDKFKQFWSQVLAKFKPNLSQVWDKFEAIFVKGKAGTRAKPELWSDSDFSPSDCTKTVHVALFVSINYQGVRWKHDHGKSVSFLCWRNITTVNNNYGVLGVHCALSWMVHLDIKKYILALLLVENFTLH